MADADFERRVDILEENMEQLREVPARLATIESQIVQLRAEMHDGLSANRSETTRLGEMLRGEMHELGDTLRVEMRGLNDQTRAEMHDLGDSLRAEMRGLNDETRAEMRTLNHETRVEMRVLHEEVISRIALLQEARAAAPRSRGTRRSRNKKS